MTGAAGASAGRAVPHLKHSLRLAKQRAPHWHDQSPGRALDMNEGVTPQAHEKQAQEKGHNIHNKYAIYLGPRWKLWRAGAATIMNNEQADEKVTLNN